MLYNLTILELLTDKLRLYRRSWWWTKRFQDISFLHGYKTLVELNSVNITWKKSEDTFSDFVTIY